MGHVLMGVAHLVRDTVRRLAALPPLVWVAAYIALIPTFATVYVVFVPDAFRDANLRFEPAFAHDRQRLIDALGTAVNRRLSSAWWTSRDGRPSLIRGSFHVHDVHATSEGHLRIRFQIRWRDTRFFPDSCGGSYAPVTVTDIETVAVSARASTSTPESTREEQHVTHVVTSAGDRSAGAATRTQTRTSKVAFDIADSQFGSTTLLARFVPGTAGSLIYADIDTTRRCTVTPDQVNPGTTTGPRTIIRPDSGSSANRRPRPRRHVYRVPPLRRLFPASETTADRSALVISPEISELLRSVYAADLGDASRASGFWFRMLYFSATTITTLGLGDITPISNAARAYVWLEAISGILVIGIFLNAIGAQLGSRRESSR